MTQPRFEFTVTALSEEGDLLSFDLIAVDLEAAAANARRILKRGGRPEVQLWAVMRGARRLEEIVWAALRSLGPSEADLLELVLRYAESRPEINPGTREAIRQIARLARPLGPPGAPGDRPADCPACAAPASAPSSDTAILTGW